MIENLKIGDKVIGWHLGLRQNERVFGQVTALSSNECQIVVRHLWEDRATVLQNYEIIRKMEGTDEEIDQILCLMKFEGMIIL